MSILLLFQGGGGSPASTGSLDATLGDVTLSATGTLDITGTEASTLDDATLAATGSLSINGALSTTLDAVTLAALGTNGAPVLAVESQGGAEWLIERESPRLPTARVVARVATLREPRPTTSRVTGRSLRPIRARVEAARITRPDTATTKRAIVRARATVRAATVNTETQATATKRARPTAVGQWNKRQMLREFWRVNRPKSSS